MRQSIGAVSTINIIIIFIAIVIALLVGTVNYYKAFKINTRILNIIEKYEGYNKFAYDEIDNFLDNIGYITNSPDCASSSHGADLVSSSNDNHDLGTKYDYCVYYHSADGTKNDPNGTGTYYNYGVITYIYVDLPLASKFKIPVYTKGERIYKFSGKFNPEAS